MASFRLTGELARFDRISCRQLFDELRLPAAYFEMYNVTFRGLFGANINEVSALGAIPEIGFDFEEMDAPFTEKEINALISDHSNDTSGAYSFKYGIYVRLPVFCLSHLPPNLMLYYSFFMGRFYIKIRIRIQISRRLSYFFMKMQQGTYCLQR